jgi:hypothetical protein
MTPGRVGLAAAASLLLAGAMPGTGSAQEPAAAAPAAPPPAPEETARQRFEEGTRAFDAGDFVAAARLFLEAYAAVPHHAALWNAARAERRAGELAPAANLYARYLREAPAGTPDRDRAIADLRALEPLLGRLQIVAPGATEIAVDGAAVDDPTVWVTPGAHLVSGRVGGEPRTLEVQSAPGAAVSVALTPPAPPPAAAVPPIAPPPPAVVGSSRSDADDGGWPAWAFLPFAGATLITGGFMIASGVDTQNLHEEFIAKDRTSLYAYDNGFFAMHRTNWLIAITAGLGAVTAGVALFAIDWNGDAPGGRVVGGAVPGGLTARAEL